MINIKRIRISDFRLFKDTEINFDNRAGIYNLLGNSDTVFGDSNSSGKSSIPLAIEQALLGKNRQGLTIDSLKHKYGTIKPRLEIEFETQEASWLLVQDYHKNTAELWKNGIKQEIKGKSNILAEVQEGLGISDKVILSLLYISSKSELFFTTPDSKAQYDLLVSLLDLDFVERYNKDSATKLTQLKAEYQATLKTMDVLRKSIENVQAQLQQMPEVDDRDFDTELKELREQLKQMEKQIKPFDRKVETIKEQIASHRSEHGILLYQKKVLSEKMKEAEGLTDVCPTCGQELPESLKKLAANYQSDWDKLQEQFDSNVSQMADKTAELQKVKKDLDGLTANKLKIEFEIKELEQYEAVRSKVKKQMELRAVLEKSMFEQTSDLAAAQRELDLLNEKIYCFNLIKEAAGPKGFVSQKIRLFVKLFNDNLIKISQDLTKGDLLIKCIESKPNTFNLTVYDGEAEFSFIELSEGLQARVKIIALLALIESIELLSGISLNQIYIDELSSSLDETGFRAMEDLLWQVRLQYPDKLIFVVSHGKKFDKVDGALLVERKENESEVRWL